MRRTLGILIGLMTLTAGTAAWAEGPTTKVVEDTTHALCADTSPDIPKPLQDYYYGGLEAERLGYAMDLWQDARLKQADDLARRYELSIYRLIRRDIDSLRIIVRRYDDDRARQNARAAANDTSRRWRGEFDWRDEEEGLYGNVWDILRIKTLLLEQMWQSADFAAKYRLMTDYIQVLRREIGLPRLKFVTDENSGGARKTE